MKMGKACVALLVFLSIFLPSEIGANPRNQQARQSRKIGVRTIRAARMPVTIDNVSARLIGKQAVLSYSITNRRFKQLEAVEVSVFVYDRSGFIKGGEGWQQTLTLPENATESFPRILESQISPGDRLILAISKVIGHSDAVEVGPAELLDAVRSRISGSR